MRVVSILVLSALVSTGCASGSSGSATPTPSVSQSSTSSSTASAASLRPLVGSLQPTNNAGNRIIGTVKLSPAEQGQYRAELQIRNGGGAQNKFPWVIRPGNCGDDSRDVLGNELAYPALTTTADGTARINGALKVTIPDGPHHVNILKGTSSMDRETVVSCANLAMS
jgi:hypothetical protein